MRSVAARHGPRPRSRWPSRSPLLAAATRALYAQTDCPSFAASDDSRTALVDALAVLEAGGLVLVAGAGADAFAQPHGLERVEGASFSTQVHRDQLCRARAAGQVALDHDPASSPLDETRKFGTVGAVALDGDGSLADLTPTGGMTSPDLDRGTGETIRGRGRPTNSADAQRAS
ncbi:isoaspartyl peptidase/L-asparaginase [Methylobacterium sp. P5_C11]